MVAWDGLVVLYYWRMLLETKSDSGWDFRSTIGQPKLGRHILKRWLSILLIIIILSLLGTIGYLTTRQKVADKFTEFYALGINGQAEDYPTDFNLQNGQIVTVEYGSPSLAFTEQWGRLTLGIVNQEGKDINYTISVQIGGTQVGIPFQGGTVDRIDSIPLRQEEKWEQEIGIMPQHLGDNQKVEIFLYKDGGAEPYLNLSLWINVR